MVEQARARLVAKPWGANDLHPWNDGGGDERIGEIWYELDDQEAPAPALLLKLLFADTALSIQVHPDDAGAAAAGHPRGKSEAWCVLRAAPGAEVALGPKRRLTRDALGEAIDDGSILDLADWRPVKAGDVASLPAGTIHALGAGLVVAEIQQRSDDAFRMFDHGRGRPLNRESAVAAATLTPAPPTAPPVRLSAERAVLIATTPFVFERLTLAPHARRLLSATRETWLLVVAGLAEVGLYAGGPGDAFHLNADRAVIVAGPEGAELLCAYPGPRPDADLLRELPGPPPDPAVDPASEAPVPVPETETSA